MGKRIVDVLLNGIKRCLAAVGDWWKGRTTPRGSEQDGTYTDQW